MKLEFLIQTANKVYNTSDVLQPTNKQNYVYGRSAIYFLLRQEGNSLESIGKIFKKDHTSIHFHLKKHDDQIKFNSLYRNLFNEFESELLNPINKTEYLKENIKKIVEQLFDLKMTLEQIEAFWLDCITIAKQKNDTRI